jgi:hypothetical protein
LTDNAVEEMGHLMSVQNLRLFIGAPVTFERERFPSPIHSIYPFELRLEPLSFGSLSKYILAEAPANKEDELQEYVKAARLRDGVRHVGIIYALLSILFSPPNFLKAAERDFWDKFVRAVAYAAPHGGGPPPADDPDNWHVDHSELHPESLARQADFRDFPTAHAGFFCPRVGGRADARELVKRIGVQGEAPVDDRDHPSHFQRFLEIAEGTSPVTAFPRGGWSPAMKVHPVPALSRYRADAREVARAFDKTYAAMLRALRAFFGKPGAKREGAGALLEEQMRDLRRLSRDLVELPPHGGRAASPLFTLPP